jgi:hypothetical protein
MTDLELMLRTAGANAAWPATPDIATAVESRIARRDAPPRRPRLRVGRPLAIAIAVLLVAATSAAAIPGIRNPVLDWLGLRSVRIERVPRPLPQPATAPGIAGNRMPVTIARSRLGFTPLVPVGLGTPVAYYDQFVPAGQLTLVYPHGIHVSEVEGRLVTRYLVKFLGPGVRVDRLRIGADRVLWIHGTPHQYAYVNRDGRIAMETIQPAGNVLLWRHGALLIRIEGARSKPAALAIARSARAAP